MKFTAYRAGHVLGASMYLIEIDGIKILYTVITREKKKDILNVLKFQKIVKLMYLL